MNIFNLVFYQSLQGWQHLSAIYYAERGAMHGVENVWRWTASKSAICKIVKYETNPEDGTTISEIVKEVKRP